MKRDAKIYVAGHTGLVGSAIMRRLQREGYTNVLTRTASELDLRDQKAVNALFEKERPEFIFLAAARVGGIKANWEQPAQFIYDNLLISANIIHAAYVYGAKKLLFLGSSCIYPRDCPQPIKEEYLLTGPLETTNDAYAMAKIAGIKMCQSYNRQYGTNFIACMPTNLYGPFDNFDLNSSHVLPALIAKFHAAKRDNKSEVVIWGSGTPYREFLYVDDLADAVLYLMRNYTGSEIVNIGTGRDNTILEVAKIIQDVVGFKGTLTFDATKPDGTPRKLLNVDRLKNAGWQAPTSLQDGIAKTYAWCLQTDVFGK
ncbi:GDP-fucose synthetase [Candidatus Dependentiae bacterium HGW-Dependentiae-1]|nr:MAG: GDP-fucose synthetase [Candidatus Dependentiae bacterium HGW-Dependentiae-1]